MARPLVSCDGSPRGVPFSGAIVPSLSLSLSRSLSFADGFARGIMELRYPTAPTHRAYLSELFASPSHIDLHADTCSEKRARVAALPLEPVHLGGRAPRVQLSAGMLASSGSAGSSHTRCTVLLLGTSPPASLDLIIEKIGGRVPSPRETPGQSVVPVPSRSRRAVRRLRSLSSGLVPSARSATIDSISLSAVRGLRLSSLLRGRPCTIHHGARADTLHAIIMSV
jgi:hypothetical protein